MEQYERRITRSFRKSQESTSTYIHVHRDHSVAPYNGDYIFSLTPGFGFTEQTRRYYNWQGQKQSFNGNGGIRNIKSEEEVTPKSEMILRPRTPRMCKDNRNTQRGLDTPYHDASLRRARERKNSMNAINSSKITKESQKIKLCSIGLEQDSIIPSDVSLNYLEGPPQGIDFQLHGLESDCYPTLIETFRNILTLGTKKGSHEMSRLRIKHEHQDSEDGDEFGATLLTHKSEFMSLEIRQHFLVDLEAKGPADKMRIKNNDELILVDGIFVPEKTHAEVVDIFHHAKVDGKTRFQMVIRRAIPYDKEKSRSKQKKKWQWIETSAILAPDAKAILHKQPDVCDVELKELPKNEYCTYVYKRYRTKNRGLFIDINDGGLKACVQRNTSGDRSKILVRTSRVTSNAEGILGYYAALSDINMKRYISVENNEVTLGGQPCWFGYDATSTDVHLKKDNNFLSCDESTGHLNIVPDEFEFVEVTVNAGRDCLDYGCQAARKITAYCSSNSEYSSSNGIHQQGFNNSMETEGALDCPDGTMSIIREHSLCSDSSKCSTAMEVD